MQMKCTTLSDAISDSSESFPFGELSLTAGARLSTGERENDSKCRHHHTFVRSYVSERSIVSPGLTLIGSLNPSGP